MLKARLEALEHEGDYKVVQCKIYNEQKKIHTYDTFCSICQHYITRVSSVYKPENCSHCYHWPCLLQWILTTIMDGSLPTCPLCQTCITTCDLLFLHYLSIRHKGKINKCDVLLAYRYRTKTFVFYNE
jgi:hypothetical protein